MSKFEFLKQHLTCAPILAYPDFSRDFILATDASNEAIGAVLSQIDQDGKEVVIGYASRTLSKPERNYCVMRKELLAVVHFVKHYKHYLYGRKFTIRTDHGSLRWLMHFKNPEGQLARWLEVLSEFNMEIVHMPGYKHSNADALSRLPCRQCGYSSNWEKTPQNSMTSVRKVCTDSFSNHLSNDKQISLRELQDKDESINFMKKKFVDNTKPTFNDISGKNLVSRCLWSQWDILEVIDGVLYRRFESQNSSKNRLQAIVPFSERRNVFFQCHDSKTSAHLGVRKRSDKNITGLAYNLTSEDTLQVVIFVTEEKPHLKGSDESSAKQFSYGTDSY